MIAQLFDHAERYRVNFGADRTGRSGTSAASEHRAIIDAARRTTPNSP